MLLLRSSSSLSTLGLNLSFLSLLLLSFHCLVLKWLLDLLEALRCLFRFRILFGQSLASLLLHWLDSSNLWVSFLLFCFDLLSSSFDHYCVRLLDRRVVRFLAATTHLLFLCLGLALFRQRLLVWLHFVLVWIIRFNCPQLDVHRVVLVDSSVVSLRVIVLLQPLGRTLCTVDIAFVVREDTRVVESHCLLFIKVFLSESKQINHRNK